jgi:hypothetical protein
MAEERSSWIWWLIGHLRLPLRSSRVLGASSCFLREFVLCSTRFVKVLSGG